MVDEADVVLEAEGAVVLVLLDVQHLRRHHALSTLAQVVQAEQKLEFQITLLRVIQQVTDQGWINSDFRFEIKGRSMFV